MSDTIQPDRITYSESRTINIGNYENVSSFLAYAGNVKNRNQIEKTIDIKHSESVEVDFDISQEDFLKCSKKAIARVKNVLDMRERQIRKATEDFVDFNTLAKAPTKD